MDTPTRPPAPPGGSRDSEQFADLPPLWQMERLQTVYRLTDDVSRARGLEEIYEAALRGLERALATERASILLFDDDGVMRFKAWHGLSDGYRRAVEGHSPWSRDAYNPQPVVVADTEEDESVRSYLELFRSEGIRALGFIPLLSRGRLIGKFMVYFGRPHPLDEEELRLAQTIARHVAFAVERRRDEERLALYREIFAHSSEAIAILDADGEYTEQNAAHRRLLGYEDEDLAGRTPAIHLGQVAFRDEMRVLGEDGIYRKDVVSISKSGQPLDLELSAFAVLDESGKPRCFVGVKRDIRARKRTEEALQFLAGASAALDRSLEYEETVRRLASLTVPRLADWAVLEVLDESGTLRPGAVVHRDPALDETVSRLFEVLSVPARAEGVRRVPSSPARRTRAAEILGDATASDPRTGPLLQRLGLVAALAVPLRARGRLLGLLTLVSSERLYEERDLALAEDFANRGSMALDNARLYREAQESDRRKEEFLAVLAHELRNPMTPLLTCLELMRTGEADPESLARWREIMERQVRNLTRLVDDLLDVSRITRGKIELQKEGVDLRSVVERAVEVVRPLMQSRSIQLEVSVGPGLSLEADPLRLEQILANLLHNAVKYTPEGGRVSVRGAREGRMVSVQVEDDGVGIDPDLLPRLFDLFMQGNRTSSGLGIGLTLVRTLVELHGGTVRASSGGPGKGSQFEVRLPMGEATDEAPAIVTRIAARPGVSRRVLVVDDNTDAALLLGEVLRMRGHDVHLAHDGASALALAAKIAPEIVLLDLGLPDLDGYEVAARLRNELGLKESLIVAVTGFGQEHHRARSAETGFSHHVVKPIDLDQLDRILERHASEAAARSRKVEEAPA
ncbi:MAG TPA: GAF domain-containing protein [Candidatus Eisenbacteria bacterium]|nr:GAF domain-containing protein [Candidatus Eisenbacteria bacterium]